MTSADIKTGAKREIKELVAVSYNFFPEVPSQNLKYNVKQTCIFNLILVGIPSSWILSVKNKWVKGFLLNDQNL